MVRHHSESLQSLQQCKFDSVDQQEVQNGSKYASFHVFTNSRIVSNLSWLEDFFRTQRMGIEEQSPEDLSFQGEQSQFVNQMAQFGRPPIQRRSQQSLIPLSRGYQIFSPLLVYRRRAIISFLESMNQYIKIRNDLPNPKLFWEKIKNEEVQKCREKEQVMTRKKNRSIILMSKQGLHQHHQQISKFYEIVCLKKEVQDFFDETEDQDYAPLDFIQLYPIF